MILQVRSNLNTFLNACVFISIVKCPFLSKNNKWENLNLSFSLTGEEDDDMSAEIRALQLDFEVPRNFLNPEKYQPQPLPEEVLDEVPDVVARAIFDAMPADVPIDAFTPFLYLRNGRLAEYAVVYFMNLVPRRVKSKMSRFFTTMHLIEMYREYIIVPPSHFLASIDTAAVQPHHSTQTSGTKAKKENKGTKVEKDEDQDKEDDSSSADQVQASTSQP